MSLKPSKIFYFILIIIIIISLHFIGLLEPIENILAKVLCYPMAGGYLVGNQVSSFFDNFRQNKNLLEQNNQLNEKIISLQTKIIELEQILNQKEILDQELQFLLEKGLRSVAAKIIARGIDANPNLIVINKGSVDGLQQGLAVVIQQGLVIGRIVNTQKTVSQVLLLSDSQSQISAASIKDGALLGVVRGNLDVGLKLEYVLKDRGLEPSDLIMTAGQEETIPAGLLIGEILQVEEDERELFKTAIVSQPALVRNINVVNVVLP